MRRPEIYNLEDFLTANDISHQYCSVVACFQADSHTQQNLALSDALPSFFNIVFVIDGCLQYKINNHEIELKANDLFIRPAFETFSFKSCSEKALSIHLLVDMNFSDALVAKNEQLPDADFLDIFTSFPVFHLDHAKASEFYAVLHHICNTIEHVHLYKQDMLKHQLQFFQLLLAELITGIKFKENDLKNRDRILKNFLHNVSRHFKKERQLSFYADLQHITPNYLSRTIKELSGITPYSFIASFLYNEICIQLRTTDKTISEIADDLGFSDHSAMTNFFKLKSHKSPQAYRKMS